MNKLEACNRIIEIINNNENGIFSLVGKNASFKTKLLEEINKKLLDKKDVNILFLKAETTFANEIKEKTSDIQFIGEIRRFINGFFSKKMIIKDKELIHNIKDTNIFLNDLVNYGLKNKDEYFKNEILSAFKIDDNLKNNIINIEFITNEKILLKISGQGMYSLLKFCSIIIEKCFQNNDYNKTVKTILIIDEPEKYCHKSLIKKISNILFKLFNLNVFVIFSSHSDFLVNEIILRFRKEGNENFFLFNHNYPNNNDANIIEIVDFISKLNNYNFSNKVKSISRREQKIIVSSFFDENIILVEGLKDYEFASYIIQNNEFDSYYFSIYDCEGKENVKKMKQIISDLNKEKNIFCFVDRDEDEPIEDNNFYEFVPNLEKVINDPNAGKKNNLDFYTQQNIQNIDLFIKVQSD